MQALAPWCRCGATRVQGGSPARRRYGSRLWPSLLMVERLAPLAHPADRSSRGMTLLLLTASMKNPASSSASGTRRAWKTADTTLPTLCSIVLDFISTPTTCLFRGKGRQTRQFHPLREPKLAQNHRTKSPDFRHYLLPKFIGHCAVCRQTRIFGPAFKLRPRGARRKNLVPLRKIPAKILSLAAEIMSSVTAHLDDRSTASSATISTDLSVKTAERILITASRVGRGESPDPTPAATPFAPLR